MKKRTIDAVALMDAMHEKEFVEWHPLDEIDAVINEAPTVLPDLNDLRNEIYRDAMAHGLWDEPRYARTHVCGLGQCRWELAERISKEVDELRQAIVDPDHYIEELADVIIIALSAAGHIGVNIDEAVRRKMEINRARPYKHEGEGHG